jgi:putative membrane protein
MMWWYGGNGGWMWVGMVLMVVFWVAVIALIVWAVRSFSGRMPAGSGGSNALDIARQRYAKGEITKGQYDQMKKDLS